MVDKIMTLKAKLWKVFSEYIRRRDADEYGYCNCISCGKRVHWKQADAGHYLSKAHGLALYFNEKNVNSQDRECNSRNNGERDKQEPYLIEKYGEGVIDELHSLKGGYVRMRDQDYLEMIEYYKERLNGLGRM